jgi:hypothetical protein
MSVVAEMPISPTAARTKQSTSGAGIAAVVLGGSSLFMPYFAAVFLVPTALVCSLVALKNKAYFMAVFGLVFSGIGALGIFSVSRGFSSGLGGTSSSVTHRITYKLDGTASSASITIENESGGTEQHVVSVPWVKEFQAAQGRYVYLSAQNQGSGQLEATIYVDGQPLQSAQTTERYGIASASGSVR